MVVVMVVEEEVMTVASDKGDSQYLASVSV